MSTEQKSQPLTDIGAMEKIWELAHGDRPAVPGDGEFEAQVKSLQAQLEDLKLALGTDRVTLRGQLKSAGAKLSALQEELRLAKEEEDFAASAQACGHAGRYRVARDSGDPHRPKQCCVLCELFAKEAEIQRLKKYARHAHDCGAGSAHEYGDSDVPACTCGLREALK